MDSDYVCKICGTKLGPYQQKHYCQDCRHVLCSSCQFQRMKLLYMTNETIDITLGFCFTCQTLKKCYSTEKEDVLIVSNESSNFTKKKTTETQDQSGTKEFRGNNSKTTEQLTDQGGSSECTGINSKHIVSEAGSFMKEGDSKEEDNCNVGVSDHPSVNSRTGIKETTINYSGSDRGNATDSNGSSQYMTNFNSNQPTDFGSPTANSKGDNTKYRQTSSAENKDFKGNTNIQRNTDYRTEGAASPVNSNLASKKKNPASREGERHVGNSKMKWNRLDDKVNDKNKDQGENVTKNQRVVVSKTESEKQSKIVTQTESKELRKADEGRSATNKIKGDNFTMTHEAKGDNSTKETKGDNCTNETKEDNSTMIGKIKDENQEQQEESEYKHHEQISAGLDQTLQEENCKSPTRSDPSSSQHTTRYSNKTLYKLMKETETYKHNSQKKPLITRQDCDDRFRREPDTATGPAGAIGGNKNEVKENKPIAIPQTKSSKLQRLRDGTFKHTCAGCGRKDCEGNFMKLLREMISTAKSAKFEIHNVTPDGNCMFAAVVDQLELQNDRSFSPRRLRQACVDFLRDNPESEDGTPYVLFLDNESWEDYLSRMCQEGQWGDHMMLQAIAQVTGRSIQVIHNDRQRDWTRIETQLPGENHMFPITLGHVGELHYVSLRPSDPVKKSLDEIIDEDFQSMDNFTSLSIPSLHDGRREMFEEDYVDYFSDIPSLHLSYLLKKLFPHSVIKLADQMMETAISMELQRQEDIQPILQQVQQSMAYHASRQSLSISVKAYGEVVEGLWVPYITERERTQFDKGSEWADVKMMHILDHSSAYPKDYKDVTEMDVFIESEHVHAGYARLLAYYPGTWGLSENSDETSITYYVPNKHASFESFTGSQGEKDSCASQNLLAVSLFIDVVNAMACPIWPKEAAEWRTRVRPADWPPSAVIDSIVQDGCHLEGKPHVNSTNPDVEFRFCFGMAERYLATQVLTKEQRLCFLLFKSLCSQEFRGENYISGDHLLSIFFYACEQLRKESWSTKLGSCLFFLLDCLLTSIQERNIPNYFIPANNMIDHLTDSQFEQIGQHVFALRSQPFPHLVTIAHQNGVLDATDILSKIQPDFSEFKEHRNTRRSVIGVLVPTTIELAQAYIHDKCYKKALETVQEAYEERLSVSTCEDQLPFSAFVSQVISRYPLASQWWFLFSADEKLGTTLCADLTLPLSPVTMEEIFPEKISKNYKGVLIPLSMAGNLCTFCDSFVSYLMDKNRTYQAFDVIQHAFEKYYEYQAQVDPNNPNQSHNFGDFGDVNVFNLYIKFFTICQKIDRLAIISEKMAEIETICGRINSVNSYTNLAYVWKILGDEAKSQAATMKVRSLKQNTFAENS